MAEEARIIIDAQLQFRHDSEAAWLEHDPVLKAGEPAYTLGYPDRFKLGDGQSKWSELPYIKPGEGGGGGGGGSQSYESLSWQVIKGLTAGDPSVLPQAFAVKQAYNELKGLIPALDDYYTKTEVDSRIPSLAGYATETFVNTAIANLINGAPTTLDTLKEIADALADNADVVEALEGAIGTKADKTTVDALDTRLDSAEANISTNTTNITAQGKTIASHTTSINTLSSDVSGLKTSVSDLEDLFDSDGKALKAVTADNATKLGGQLPSYYATASALMALTTRVSTAETNITNLTNNKLNKSVWDSVFEIDSNGNLKVKVGIYSPSFITARTSDPNTGGGSGGAFSLYTWTQVKALTSEVGGVAPTAYALKQAYNEIGVSLDGKASTSSVTALTTRVASLESKATSVSVSQTLTTGTEIGKITIDGVSKALYAPSSIAWGSVTGKPSFATVATSGKYSDLSGLPTIPSAVTESTVSGWGFTKNAGTITGIKMNGASKGTSGVVDLGTVITAHQSLTHLLDKTTAAATYQTIISATNKIAYANISGTPTSLPASDVYAWAKAATKPSYTAAEVGALATSGGTITSTSGYMLTLNRISTGPTLIAFQNNNTLAGFLGISVEGEPLYLNSNASFNTLLHSGNYSDYALPKAGGTLTGLLSLEYTNPRIAFKSDANTTIGAIGAKDGVLSAYVIADNSWHTLIHSGNIRSYNAGSATKLETARTIWGQSFDGKGDVSSTLYLPNNIAIASANASGTNKPILRFNSSNVLVLGEGTSTSGYNTAIQGNNVYLQYGTSNTNGLILNSSGGVTIGSSDLAGTSAKLYVNGTANFSGVVTMSTGLAGARILNASNYSQYLDITLTDVKCTFNAYDTDGWTDYYFKSCGNEILILNGRTLQATFAGGVYATTGTFTSNVHATGSIYSATGLYSAGYVSGRGADTSSDRRLKDNITPLRNALSYVLGTNYVSFDWKDTREKSIGIIAQEEMGREWGCLVQKHSETYSYLYGQHTALLGAALQEEDKKVEGLKRRIQDLENEVKRLMQTS